MLMSETKFYPPIPSLKPAAVKIRPQDEKYKLENRIWQGCPSITRTKGGRLWATWFSGGDKEPGYGNFDLVAYSDDDGESWNEAYLVVEADEDHHDRCIDINLWVDPDDNLYITYVQLREFKVMHKIDQMWAFYDGIFGTWAIKCSNPDDAEPTFEPPVRWCDGYMRNRPTVLSSGEWIAPAYDWLPPDFLKTASFRGSKGTPEYSYHFRISDDKGKTWRTVSGPQKPGLIGFDEIMILEGKEAQWHFFARVKGGILYAVSYDRGETWENYTPVWMNVADSRFFIRRLSSGNVILVYSGPNRTGLFAKISTDDCKTWSEPLMLDDRRQVSYPDGFEDTDGMINIAYDRERYGAREILFARFTEADILKGELVTNGTFLKKIISKVPESTPHNPEQYKAHS